MLNPDTAPYVNSYFLPSFEAAAQSFKVAPILARVHSDAEIETVINLLGKEPGGGLIVMPDNFMDIHRAAIILQVARNNIPAVYQLAVFVRDGGLLPYGADFRDIFVRAAPTKRDAASRSIKPQTIMCCAVACVMLAACQSVSDAKQNSRMRSGTVSAAAIDSAVRLAINGRSSFTMGAFLHRC